MASDRNDFFLSRRGSVATVAREVADVLAERGYKVLVQDYDIPYGASFVEAMHEAVKNSRDLAADLRQRDKPRRDQRPAAAWRRACADNLAIFRLGQFCLKGVARCDERGRGGRFLGETHRQKGRVGSAQAR